MRLPIANCTLYWPLSANSSTRRRCAKAQRDKLWLREAAFLTLAYPFVIDGARKKTRAGPPAHPVEQGFTRPYGPVCASFLAGRRRPGLRSGLRVGRGV